jgi:TonB-linked SusC/RagA family outer membrane protein
MKIGERSGLYDYAPLFPNNPGGRMKYVRLTLGPLLGLVLPIGVVAQDVRAMRRDIHVTKRRSQPMRIMRFVGAIVAVAAIGATDLAAQEPAIVQGQVLDEAGTPRAGVSVLIERLTIATVTDRQGRYLMTIPAARFSPGQQVDLTVRVLGYRTVTSSVTLQPGARIVHDFNLVEDPLRLDEIVVTGVGTQRVRERLGVTQNSVTSEDILRSAETNVVAAMAGKAPNVQVQTSAGDPGAGAYFRIRGSNTVYGGTQPLVVIDGQPVNNSTVNVETTTAGTVLQNRLMDINPHDIESIEILKGPSAAALYGSQAASGVVLITTKRGRPGTSQMSYRVAYSNDQVNQIHDLQTSYRQGIDGTPIGAPTQNFASVVTWGQPLECAGRDPETGRALNPGNCVLGVDYFDHATQIFRTGHQLDHTFNFSGGTDRTAYYLSLGRLDHQGVIDGNSNYERTTVRLRGSHAFADALTIGGNIAYTNSHMMAVQQGSNISGLLLGALRTPPEFDNREYLTETGLHRSYRMPNPTTLAAGRGYDNPFWVAREMPNTSDVYRTLGNLELDYRPADWMTVSWNLGVDYSSDDRLSVFPKSSSDYPDGRLIRANFQNQVLNSNFAITATRQFNPDFGGVLTVGQALTQEDYSRYQVDGYNLIVGTDKLDFTVSREPWEFESRVRTDGYFAQGTAELFDELFLTGKARMDGSSTYGGRVVYPAMDASWVFSNRFHNLPGVDYGRLRAAWGVTGKQPPVYSNVSAFNTATISDGWIITGGLQTIYRGLEGVVTQATLGNPDIEPERTQGFDVGIETVLLNNLATLNVTFYNETTTGMLLAEPLPRSTGYSARWNNLGEVSNRGLEIELGLNPVRTPRFSWNVNGQWATNRSCVNDLGGAEFIYLAGFIGSQVGLVAPERDANGRVTHCYEYGTFYGDDFVRFGRGITVGGANIDQAISGWNEGDLYIGADGFPVYDGQLRALGSEQPDWTASLRNTITLFGNLRVSALLDFDWGSVRWNGTRGALDYFGTSKSSERFRGVGHDSIFPGHGPGAGKTVRLNWDTWTLSGLGSGFTGPASQYMEEASWVKLRDISASYRLDNQQWLDRFGFSSADLSVTARNLATWTNYSGLDPETNLQSQSAGRGLDYFNNPQTRSLGFTVQLNR